MLAVGDPKLDPKDQHHFAHRRRIEFRRHSKGRRVCLGGGAEFVQVLAALAVSPWSI